MEPVVVDGPEHPHAFTGIPIDRRPAHATHKCTKCKGHGAWNSLLYPDTGRCIINPCDECDGSGWVSSTNDRVIDDIAYDERGMPRWVLRVAPREIATAVVAQAARG